MSENPIFHSQTYGPILLDGAVLKISEFMRSAPTRSYKIIVGTDSEASDVSSLVTAVTVWRIGNGAIHFWTRSAERRFPTLRDRIWQEAINSITLAQELRSRLKEALGEDLFWDGNEVHVDIGEYGPTKEFIPGVVGMIRGYEFTPVIKPAAFGASIVADRYT